MTYGFEAWSQGLVFQCKRVRTLRENTHSRSIVEQKVVRGWFVIDAVPRYCQGAKDRERLLMTDACLQLSPCAI